MTNRATPFYLDKQLLGIILIAFLYRVLFYTGVFGSDESAYNGAAIAFLNGTSGEFSYIGAIRYGINIPVAFFFSLFGINELSASLWSFICSLGEVILVYIFANKAFGRQVAFFAAIILATVPLHVHFAGRMLADSVLAFFLTLAVYLFYRAETETSTKFYFLTGIAHGITWYIKSSVTILAAPILIIYAFLTRTFNGKWAWIVFGGLSVLVSHLFLMWIIHNDPMFLFNSKVQAMGRIAKGEGSSPLLYLKFLLIDLRHVWILGLMALAGLYTSFKYGLWEKKQTKLISIWFVFLLLVLSIIPLRQANYILNFVAPMSILAGIFLVNLPKILSKSVIIVWIFGATLLSGLEQQSIKNYVANSIAATDIILESPKDKFFVTKRNLNVLYSLSKINDDIQIPQNVKSFKFLNEGRSLDNMAVENAFVIFDHETSNVSFNKVKTFFIESGYELHFILDITPKGYGIGLSFIKGIRYAVRLILPVSFEQKALLYIDGYIQPKPSKVYQLIAANANAQEGVE